MGGRIKVTPIIEEGNVIEIREIVGTDIDSGNEVVLERERVNVNMSPELYKEREENLKKEADRKIKALDEAEKKLKKADKKGK